MGNDLRAALLNAGLVNQADVERLEKKRAKEAEEAAARAAKSDQDRAFAAEFGRQWGAFFGKTRPRFYFWIKSGRVPQNVSEVCCVCGNPGKSVMEGVIEIAATLEVCSVNVWDVMASGDPTAFAALRAIVTGAQADVLYEFSTRFQPDLERLLKPGDRLHVCGSDRQKMLDHFADAYRLQA